MTEGILEASNHCCKYRILYFHLCHCGLANNFFFFFNSKLLVIIICKLIIGEKSVLPPLSWSVSLMPHILLCYDLLLSLLLLLFSHLILLGSLRGWGGLGYFAGVLAVHPVFSDCLLV